MVRAATQRNEYQVDRFDTAFGKFALVHLGVFQRPSGAATPDGRIGCILDGWVWNYPKEWCSPGIAPEDIAHHCLEGYRRNGADFVKSLNGEFNILIWDEGKNQVVLLSDRYGLRPLQYGEAQNSFVFAPEGKSVAAGLDRSLRLDHRMVLNWLSVGRALFEGRTFFDEIRALPAAAVVTWKAGRTTVEQHWDYAYHPRSCVDDDFVDEVADAFRRAVQKRIVPGLRYGITLSGGLDSRLIASALAPACDFKATACTFGAPQGDDVVIARQVAERLSMPWECIELTAEDFIRDAAEGIRLTEGLDLFVQSYALSVYPQLRRHADVLFTGLALDATLGASYINEGFFAPNIDSESALRLIAKKVTYFDHAMVSRLFRDKTAPDRAASMLAAAWQPERLQTNWGDHAERFSMIHRVNRMIFWRQGWQRMFVEDTSPTFDNEVIDLMLQVPTAERLNHRLYQRVMTRLCPDLMGITYQRTMLPASAPIESWKEGAAIEERRESLYTEVWRATNGRVHLPYNRYMSNYDEWLRIHPMWQAATDDLLCSPKSLLWELGIDANYVRELVERHRSAAENHRQRLVQLMGLELLLREFFA